MAIALNNKIQYWSGRLRNGQVGSFFSWWFGELAQILPATWRERMQHALRRVTLIVNAGQLKLGIEENRSASWLESFSLDQEAALQKQGIRSLLEKHDIQETPRFLLLDAGKILHKPLTLPAATEPNLQQVLAFEMDRQTPFRAADVYFTWQLLGADKDNAQIKIDLFVVQRKPVDATLELLAARGLAVSGVDVIDRDKTLGINLLPAEKRFRMINPKSRLNYSLAAAALVLVIVLMMQSVNLRAHRVESLETGIADVQDEARRVQRLREQVTETSEAASFLTRKRSASPMAIELLAEITRTLPDDTYLDRLVISQEGVLMQGKSSNAQHLIETVNSSGLFDNAAFRGSTRLDSASGLEIFEINATIAKPGES
jgi:general secretion pathway protein L